MREIKFRAWDEQNKVMHNEVEFIRSGIDGNDWILFKSDKQKLEDGNVLNNPYFQQQIKLMQYTGLKDAINKNEIYEHDIINLLGVGFLKVEWDYKHTGWICLDKHYKKRNLADVLLNGGIRVGNIYENPELLKEGI